MSDTCPDYDPVPGGACWTCKNGEGPCPLDTEEAPMSDTPARDALIALPQDEHHDDGLVYADTFADRALANPDLVLAALIESGWTPTDDQLRAMGLTFSSREYLFRDEALDTWTRPKEHTDE